jgi:SAM-dependent methyltransferase
MSGGVLGSLSRLPPRVGEESLDSSGIISHDWDWWAYQFRVVHRRGIPGIETYDRHLVAFIVDVLRLQPGARVLDVGCGSGVHAMGLARRGLQVVGLDIAPSLVRHCTDEALAAGLDNVAFVEGDMRDLGDRTDFTARFDAVTVLSTSFGFFTDAVNQRVMDGIRRTLRPGGQVLLQVMDPITFAQRTQDGVHLEERPEGSYWTESWFDPATFTSHSRFRFTDVRGIVHEWDEHERIRVYTLPELKQMMARVGLGAARAYGDVSLPPRPYGIDCSRQLIVVAERVTS